VSAKFESCNCLKCLEEIINMHHLNWNTHIYVFGTCTETTSCNRTFCDVVYTRHKKSIDQFNGNSSKLQSISYISWEDSWLYKDKQGFLKKKKTPPWL
jgi:hypothetical protein